MTEQKNFQTISPRPEPLSAPLSYEQQRLWFLFKLNPEDLNYNIMTVLQLKGPLDLPNLEGSLNQIMRRHEILRTIFSSEDGQPYQQVTPNRNLSLEVEDFRILPYAERLASAKQVILKKVRQPFDLELFPILRAGLYRLGTEDHIFYMITHHIIFDGWSQVVFINELCEHYRAYQSGEPAGLEALPIQYGDFAAWQRGQAGSQRLQGDLAFWLDTLKGSLPVLDLPNDKPRPPVQTVQGASESLVLPDTLTTNLKRLGRSQNATLFMTLLAGFAALLNRCTNETDILIGIPFAGRTQMATESLIGMFVNTLVLRINFSGDPTFLELLDRVREACLGAYSHPELPFDMLVAKLNPERDLSRSPIFQVFFNMHSFDSKASAAGDLSVIPVRMPVENTIFDLYIDFSMLADAIHFDFCYNTDLFFPETIRRLADHYRILLEEAASQPDSHISELNLLSETECEQILVSWNDTRVDISKDSTVAGMFSEQAARSPDAPALIFDGNSLSYGVLECKTNQLARWLINNGVGPEVKVGLLLERSPEAMIAILAVLKAGGAYVPLDPGLPQARVSAMLADAQVSLLLTKDEHQQKLDVRPDRVLCLDSDWQMGAVEGAEIVHPQVSPENLAYLIYTSGSTGSPKGVLGTYKGLLNRLTWMWNAYPFREGEICCQKTSLSMVDSICEVLSPLLQGTPLVLAADDDVKDPIRFVRLLGEYRVSRLVLVPSLLDAVLATIPDLQAQLPDLRLCVSSGETLPVNLARRFKEALPDCDLLNLYGSSEVSADVSWHPVAPADLAGAAIPIGRPITNTQIYILDRFYQLAPIGTVGQIYIGGDNLARGYNLNPALTAERFIPNPFGDQPGSRLYRTGDLGRCQPDGTIVYLGRNDNQVKLRGYRIELGETQQALEDHPAVRQAEVVLRDDLPGGRGLAAYLICEKGTHPSSGELRRWLEERLPAYMLPAAYVILDRFPLTPGGKVDRRALPTTEMAGSLKDKASSTPRSALERQLVQIWEEVLGVKPVGIRDNFFDLGGHSLLDIRLLARIENELGINLPLIMILKSPTVELLAEAIQSGEFSPEWSILAPIQPAGSKPPLFLVHGLGGGVLDYAAIAEKLNPDQPLYGLMASGFTSGGEPDHSIEAMALRYIEAVKSVQPHGPYLLGGYCYGGVVAYEMARLLHSQGEQIALLAMIEGYAPHLSQESVRWWDPRTLARFLINLPNWLYDCLRREKGVQYLVKQLIRRLSPAYAKNKIEPTIQRVLDLYIGNEQFVTDRYRGLMEAHLQAIRSYCPQIYHGRLTLFRVKLSGCCIPMIHSWGGGTWRLGVLNCGSSVALITTCTYRPMSNH